MRNSKEEMLNTRQQSELTGLAVPTINSMKRRGILPYDTYQVTPTMRVAKKSDVLAWLESRKIEGKKEENKYINA